MTESGLAEVVGLPTTNAVDGLGTVHVWNQFTVRVRNEPNHLSVSGTPAENRRDAVRAALAEMNVGSEIYYPIPLHQQECFQYLDSSCGDLPETERAASEVLALPIFPELTAAEQEYVVSCLNQVMGVGQIRYRKAS